ncbi:hypothetical protein HDU98_004071 [Podochytrium sp. JEL0797]|nr:hypothetical protein HDU98_004071 [Podochytrium sp. JEL0797]
MDDILHLLLMGFSWPGRSSVLAHLIAQRVFPFTIETPLGGEVFVAALRYGNVQLVEHLLFAMTHVEKADRLDQMIHSVLTVSKIAGHRRFPTWPLIELMVRDVFMFPPEIHYSPSIQVLETIAKEPLLFATLTSLLNLVATQFPTAPAAINLTSVFNIVIENCDSDNSVASAIPLLHILLTQWNAVISPPAVFDAIKSRSVPLLQYILAQHGVDPSWALNWVRDQAMNVRRHVTLLKLYSDEAGKDRLTTARYEQNVRNGKRNCRIPLGLVQLLFQFDPIRCKKLAKLRRRIGVTWLTCGIDAEEGDSDEPAIIPESAYLLNYTVLLKIFQM